MGLADRVKTARQAKGWTREALAVYAGVSATTVARIERGDHRPRAAVVIALAHALEIPVEELAAAAGIQIHIPKNRWS